MKKLTAAGLKNIIVKTLKEHKGIDILALNIKKITDIADYMIICTANSTTHAKALTEKLCEKTALENIKPIGIEGDNTREWMLLDYSYVIVHIMLDPIRKYYDLEKLWGLKKIKRGDNH